MIAGAIGHMVSPEIYAPMIPSNIPEMMANSLAAIAEAAVGLALFIPKTKNKGGFGFMVLMIAFMPIHVWDALQDVPVVGSTAIAIVRIFIQLLLIYTGWWIYKLPEAQSSAQ